MLEKDRPVVKYVINSLMVMVVGTGDRKAFVHAFKR